jgi:uncharacterized protein
MSTPDASTFKTVAARENAERVRRCYAAFNTVIDTLLELIDENSSWETPGTSSVAGDYRGRDAVFAQAGCYGGEDEDTFMAELLYAAEDDGEDGTALESDEIRSETGLDRSD